MITFEDWSWEKIQDKLIDYAITSLEAFSGKAP